MRISRLLAFAILAAAPRAALADSCELLMDYMPSGDLPSGCPLVVQRLNEPLPLLPFSAPVEPIVTLEAAGSTSRPNVSIVRSDVDLQVLHQWCDTASCTDQSLYRPVKAVQFEITFAEAPAPGTTVWLASTPHGGTPVRVVDPGPCPATRRDRYCSMGSCSWGNRCPDAGAPCDGGVPPPDAGSSAVDGGSARSHQPEVDLGGCSASSPGVSPLLLAAVALFVWRRRRTLAASRVAS